MTKKKRAHRATGRPRGRPKGTGIQQKRVKDAKMLLSKYQGGDPLKWLLRVIQGDITEYQGQKLTTDHLIEVVKLAMPYLYPKLQAVEISGTMEHKQVESIEDYVKRVQLQNNTFEVVDNKDNIEDVEYKSNITEQD